MSKPKSSRKVEFYEPQPRREDIRGACFWPDTLFVDLSSYPDEYQSFSADQLRVWAEGDLGIFVAAAARTHEQLHWLQTAGTTFGRFLALNRVVTGQLADAILATASRAEITRLSDERRRGKAPAQRNDAGALHHGDRYSLTLQSLFDHWWSTIFLEHYLVDDRRDVLGPVDPRFMVGLSLRYGMSNDDLRDVFNAPDTRFLETTRLYGPRSDAWFAPIKSKLTVRHIEEAAALAEQHLCNENFARELPGERGAEYMARALQWTLERFVDRRHSLYTKALHYFSRRVAMPNEERLFELLLLVCDIALNPPIPDDGSPLAMDWSDFHPVCRFERLVDALGKNMVAPGSSQIGPGKAWWSERRAQLCAQAGLIDGASQRFSSVAVGEMPTALEAPFGYIRQFVREAGRNLARLREFHPAAVTSPVHALRDDPDGFISALAGLSGPAFDPPLNIKSFGDGEPSATLDERRYVEALFAITIRRATCSWLVNSGALDFRGLPSDPTATKAQEAAVERLTSRYGISP